MSGANAGIESVRAGSGSHTPYFTDIVVDGLRSVDSPSGAESVLDGLNSSHPLGLTLEDVSLDTTVTTAEYAAVGLYDTDLKPSGTGTSTSTVAGSGSVPSCSFPAYPAL